MIIFRKSKKLLVALVVALVFTVVSPGISLSTSAAKFTNNDIETLRSVSEITKNNTLLVGDYAFELNDSSYTLNNYLIAAKTTYFNKATSKHEIYYYAGNAWYDLVAADEKKIGLDDSVKVAANKVNGNGTFKYLNMKVGSDSEKLNTFLETLDKSVTEDFSGTNLNQASTISEVGSKVSALITTMFKTEDGITLKSFSGLSNPTESKAQDKVVELMKKLGEKLIDLNDRTLDISVTYGYKKTESTVSFSVKYNTSELPILVSAISVEPAELTLTVGDTETITATISPSNATNKDVTWESSDETVATVVDGEVTAVAVGEATITVTTDDGEFTATTAVTVTTTVVDPQDIQVAGNGFVNSSTYKGVFVEISLPGTANDQIESLKVELFNDEGNLIGTNTLNSVDSIGSTLTSPFVVIPGTYESKSWETTWVGEASIDNAPVKAVITAVDNNGLSYSAEADYTGDWESIWPVAMIGTTTYSSLKDALDDVTDGDTIIELFKDARLEYGARDAYGNESTQKVTIKGNGKELTLHQTDSDWSSIGLTGADAIFALEDVNVVKTTVGGNGAWNNHAINFSSKIELTNTTFSNAINLSADAKLTGVTITEDREYYGIWIGANGQTVTIEDTTVTANTNGGRGIKISDQYIGTPQLVNLSVSNSTFNTAKKSAIIVGSEAGAEITIDNLNIENVQADKINAVWVDEGWAEYQDKVTVTGGTKTLEGAVARIGDTGYKSIQEAITAASSGSTINILSDVSFVEVNANGKNLTFMGTDAKPIISFPKVGYKTHYGSEFTFKNLTLDFAATGNYHGIQPAKLTVKNSVINGILWGYADDIIVTDSVFNQNTNGYNMWTYGSNVTIERSEFNSLGRSLLIYNEGHGQQPAKIVIIDSTFNASEKYDKKAAIEIDASLGKFDVEIENTTATGFDTETEDGGIVLSKELVNLKKADDAEGNLTVSIDDVEVYPNYTVVNTTNGKGYFNIQAAIDAATVGNNVIKVHPGDHGTGSIDIIQKEGVNITLEAVEEIVLKNQIRISGAGRGNDEETLTIKGFTFDFTDATGAVDIISATKGVLDDTNNYAHNITIDNNVFKGNPSVDVVAIRTNGVFGLEIKSSQGIGLHSLGQIQGQSKYFRVIDTTVEGGESGINYYGPADVEIRGLTVEGTAYGVRAGQGSGVVTTATLTISDSNLNTLVPVWLRGDAPGTVTITNSNLEPTEDGPMIYDVTSGTVNITIDGKQVLADGLTYDAASDTYEISNANGLRYYAEAINADGTYSDATVKLTQDIDLKGIEWTPIYANGYTGPGNNATLTIDGNGHTISDLSKPLIGKVWSAIKVNIKNLTISHSTIVDDEQDSKGNVGVGAFIGSTDAFDINLENCHLIESTVKGGHWTGGLVGYLTGSANGMGKMNILNSSVINSKIEGEGSAGSLLGHATGSARANIDITNATVTGNTVTSTGASSEKAGSVMGTVGAGTVKVNNLNESNNTVKSNETIIIDRIYGRLAGGSLVID